MTKSQATVSDRNRTPIIQIITWIALAISVLVFLAHAGLRLYVSESLNLEILAGFLALVLCAAQSLSVSFQAANGFGKPFDLLSRTTVQSQFKAEYAATILFILSICLSKLVIVAFIRSLSPKVVYIRMNNVLGALSVLWTIGSVCSAAFGCGLPQPWDRLSGKCSSRLNWWYAVSAFNILTEVGLIGLECTIAFTLQVQRVRKLKIIGIFICRACVSIAIVVHLIFLHHDHTGPLRADLSLGYWRSAVCQQAVQCLAIVTTSLPYAKMFMTSLDSGMIRIDDARRRGEDYSKGSNGRAYELLGISNDGTRQAKAASRSSEATGHTGISQTKIWTVESKVANTGESSPDNLGLAI